jgi:hypothetical protein
MSVLDGPEARLTGRDDLLHNGNGIVLIKVVDDVDYELGPDACGYFFPKVLEISAFVINRYDYA